MNCRSLLVPWNQSSTYRRRSAFTITDTELNVMAALAQIGLTSSPRKG